jgi:hypothetical protein
VEVLSSEVAVLSASEMAWSWAEARAAKRVMLRSFIETILAVKVELGENRGEAEGGLKICRYGYLEREDCIWQACECYLYIYSLP